MLPDDHTLPLTRIHGKGRPCGGCIPNSSRHTLVTLAINCMLSNKRYLTLVAMKAEEHASDQQT